MKYMESALDVLRRTEEALRSLIADAMSNQEYKQIASIASLADGVATLARANGVAVAAPPVPCRDVRPPEPALEDKPSQVHNPPMATILAARGRQSIEPHRRRPTTRRRGRRAGTTNAPAEGASPAAKPEGLPRFLREADRLVKIGWSERDHRVYEHRAPRSTVFEFARRACEKASETTAFTMDDVLPLRIQDGRESPSYQAYLALAWLRTVGAIQRVGKDGYAAKRENLKPEAVEHLWNSLDAREARPIMEQTQ